MDIKIIIATHKQYNMPADELYLPVHVGAAEKEEIGYTKDSTGDNISNKNPFFCELTGLYWAWKNLKNDYIGLVHYRRYFFDKKTNSKNINEKFKNILSQKNAEKILTKVDVILPTKRKYYIETLYNHYKHTMFVEPLEITFDIIKEKYPEYLNELNKIKNRTSAHMFNMFVMKREILDKYCTWLFDILFELEKRVDQTKYSDFHKRFYGRISELLLDVWINKNNINYAEVYVGDMEKINWINKIFSFLRAKFFGKKYGKSF